MACVCIYFIYIISSPNKTHSKMIPKNTIWQIMFQVFWGNTCQHVNKFFDHRLQRLDVAERHEKLRFTTPFTATRHPEGGEGGETNIKTPLQIGRAPKGSGRIPTIHFQGLQGGSNRISQYENYLPIHPFSGAFVVSFREGKYVNLSFTMEPRKVHTLEIHQCRSRWFYGVDDWNPANEPRVVHTIIVGWVQLEK